MQSYVDWLRSPDDVLRLTGEVFAAAPQAMARSVTLQQTVELVRQTIEVAEQNLPAARRARRRRRRAARNCCGSAARSRSPPPRVYARAAEARGSWDDRLEALVIDGLVRGAGIGDPLPSQLAALGWSATGSVAAVVGAAPDKPAAETLAEVHAVTGRLGLDAMAGVHGPRLVVVFGGAADPYDAARTLVPVFGDGPVVLGPVADIAHASAVTQAALSGLRAAPAWPGAPRPVSADALLPERALAGDADAREELVGTIYQPLVESGDVLIETVTTFLDSGGALETTARALFVHANTVRYRLRRVAEVCGQTPNDARGAFTLRVALALGRLRGLSQSDKRRAVIDRNRGDATVGYLQDRVR